MGGRVTHSICRYRSRKLISSYPFTRVNGFRSRARFSEFSSYCSKKISSSLSTTTSSCTKKQWIWLRERRVTSREWKIKFDSPSSSEGSSFSPWTSFCTGPSKVPCWKEKRCKFYKRENKKIFKWWPVNKIFIRTDKSSSPATSRQAPFLVCWT